MSAHPALRRRRGSDQGVVLGLAMQREVEDVASDLAAAVEIDLSRHQFIARRRRLRRDLAGWRDDQTAADQVAALLASCLGDAYGP